MSRPKNAFPTARKPRPYNSFQVGDGKMRSPKKTRKRIKNPRISLVHRLAYSGDVVAFKLGRRPGKRIGGSACGCVGVCKGSSASSKPLGQYSLWKSSLSPRGHYADPPIRFPPADHSIQHIKSTIATTTKAVGQISVCAESKMSGKRRPIQ